MEDLNKSKDTKSSLYSGLMSSWKSRVEWESYVSYNRRNTFENEG